MYAAMTSRYPLHIIIQKINEVLVSLPTYPVTDVTSLTGVLNQREYTLPAAAVPDLRSVEVEEGDSDSDDRRWTPVANWDIIPATSSTGALLKIPYDITAGKIIKLVYGERHPSLRLYTDALEEVIHPDRIVYEAAAGCIRWYQDKSRTSDYDNTLAMLQTLAERAKLAYPMPGVPSKPSRICLPWPYFGRR